MLDLLAGTPAFILDYVVNIIFALVAAVLLPQAYKLLKIKADDSRRKLIEDAMLNGIKWALAQAIARAGQQEGKSNTVTWAIRDAANAAIHDPAQIVEDASNYVRTGASGTLSKLKVDDETLKQRIEARLPAALQQAEQATLL